jgi:hypothetical protein
MMDFASYLSVMPMSLSWSDSGDCLQSLAIAVALWLTHAMGYGGRDLARFLQQSQPLVAASKGFEIPYCFLVRDIPDMIGYFSAQICVCY